jgi:hypothetical protein
LIQSKDVRGGEIRESGRYEGVKVGFGGDVGVCKWDTFVGIGLSRLLISMERHWSPRRIYRRFSYSD